MILYLIQGITFGFAAAVQPGPLQTFLMSQALRYGWRRTLPAAFAPLISDGPIIVLVLVVLSRIPLWLEQMLQTAGGFFLLYLAYGAYKTWREYREVNSETVPAGNMSVLKAAMVNLLNPNPYLGWMLVMGPLLMKGWRESSVNGISLVVGFYGTMVVGGAGIVLLFSSLRKLGPRLNRTLIGLSALGLAALGLFQLWQGTMAHWWSASLS
jgi:threonine/homoserine/homoserine lactone efflux protein